MSTATWLPALTLAFILAASTASSQQKPAIPPRDTATVAAPGTSIIRGRVTDRETGLPVGRVMVTLLSNVWREQAISSAALMAQSGIAEDSSRRPTQPRQTVTDADGRFEFKQIPAGAYTVSFTASMTRGTHLDQTFGESAPRDPLKSTRRVPPIELREGETRENVDVALWRAFAVEGRVVDDSGEPVANAEVNISQWDGPSTMSMGRPRTTDDRGMFRLFGLRSGQYRICADAGLPFFGPTDETKDKLIRTCFPSAVSDGDAQPVVVSAAEAVPIEIRLQRNRTYRITGFVIDAAGAPVSNPSVQIISGTPGGASSSHSVQVKPGGHFIASGVTPGDYAIQANTGSWRLSSSEEKADREMGYVPVRVDGADIDGVVVSTSKATKVAGRIVFEGAVPDRGQKLSILTMPEDTTGPGRAMFGPQAPAAVRDDMSFELDGLFGPQVLRVAGAPRGWIVKSVRYRGDDITDLGVEFKSSSDPTLLEITLTNHGALITGRVLGDDGKDSADASIVILPADLSRWRPVPGLPWIPTKPDGTFTIGPVRAGEYVVAAVTGLSMARLFEPSARAEIAARIAKVGERIILAENEKYSVELRITKLQ